MDSLPAHNNVPGTIQFFADAVNDRRLLYVELKGIISIRDSQKELIKALNARVKELEAIPSKVICAVQPITAAARRGSEIQTEVSQLRPSIDPH